MGITKYEDLKIWKLCIDITKEIYQIRRAVVSISSNIVEGFEKNNNKEFRRYLRIAKGSNGEVRNQLYISKVVGYISDDDYVGIEEKLIKLGIKIGAMISYLNKTIN